MSAEVLVVGLSLSLRAQTYSTKPSPREARMKSVRARQTNPPNQASSQNALYRGSVIIGTAKIHIMNVAPESWTLNMPRVIIRD